MKTRILGVLVVALIAFSVPGQPAGSCSTGLVCDDGTRISCSCPYPNGGSCASYPSGSPWGGYILCQCSGSPFVKEIHCNAPTCTQESCNNQCGGFPGAGVCSGNTCYCY